MSLFSFTQCNEDVFSSNFQERLPLSSFSLGLASSAAAVPSQPLLCPKGEGARSLQSRPLVATALTYTDYIYSMLLDTGYAHALWRIWSTNTSLSYTVPWRP